MSTLATQRRRPSNPIRPPRLKPIYAGRLEIPRDLQLDPRLSAVQRIILGSLTLWGRSGDWFAWKTDEQIAAVHGVTVRTVQLAIAAGERVGWVKRMTPDELRTWLESMGFQALWANVPLIAKSSRRVIVLLWEFPDRVPELGPDSEPVHLEPTFQVDPEPTFGVHAGAPRTTVPPGTSVPVHLEPAFVPHACASYFEREFNENDNDRSPSLSPPEPEDTPEQIAQWERDRAHPGSVGIMARLNLLRVKAAKEEASAPPEPVLTPKVERLAPSPAPPPPAAHKPRSGAETTARGLVDRLATPDNAAAVDALLLFLMTELRVAADDGTTLNFWRASFARFGASEGGRAAVKEILRATFGRGVQRRDRFLSSCLAREHQTWGAQKPVPGATFHSTPGTGEVGPPSLASKYTRRVTP